MGKNIQEFTATVDSANEALEVTVGMEKTFGVDCSDFAIRPNEGEGNFTVTYDPNPPQGE